MKHTRTQEQTFTLSPGYIEVSLFPEFVALAKVTAEVVLVLHHVLEEKNIRDIIVISKETDRSKPWGLKGK